MDSILDLFELCAGGPAHAETAATDGGHAQIPAPAADDQHHDPASAVATVDPRPPAAPPCPAAPTRTTRVPCIPMAACGYGSAAAPPQLWWGASANANTTFCVPAVPGGGTPRSQLDAPQVPSLKFAIPTVPTGSAANLGRSSNSSSSSSSDSGGGGGGGNHTAFALASSRHQHQHQHHDHHRHQTADSWWPNMARKQKVDRFLRHRRQQKAAAKANSNSNSKGGGSTGRSRPVDETKQGIASKRARVQGRFKSTGTVWISAQ